MSTQAPPEPATSITEYVPEVRYVCDGFCDVEIPPSPKFQFHCVAPVDPSVNIVGLFMHPFATVNDATGDNVTVAGSVAVL